MTPMIRDFMTEAPHTIGHDQMLERAHELMRVHHIRHLPVLQGGKLVGVVSDRDLHLVETLSSVDPARTPVSEAMSQDVLGVPLTASLFDVAQDMASSKYGSAVVLDGTRVVGVFTTIDALRILASLRAGESSALARAPHT
jgi:acetoin utilization protein AcuB